MLATGEDVRMVQGGVGPVVLRGRQAASQVTSRRTRKRPSQPNRNDAAEDKDQNGKKLQGEFGIRKTKKVRTGTDDGRSRHDEQRPNPRFEVRGQRPSLFLPPPPLG